MTLSNHQDIWKKCWVISPADVKRGSNAIVNEIIWNWRFDRSVLTRLWKLQSSQRARTNTRRCLESLNMHVDGWAIGSSRVMLFRLLCVCFYLGALRSTATVADRQEVRNTPVTFLLLISTVLGMSSTLGASKKNFVLFQWNLIGGNWGEGGGIYARTLQPQGTTPVPIKYRDRWAPELVLMRWLWENTCRWR